VESFDAWAESYREAVERSISFSGQGLDHFTRRKAQELVRLAERHLGPTAALRALDVGCGVGFTDRFLAGAFQELHGVDVAAESVERARLDNPAVRYEICHDSTLPYPDGHFDLAFAICVAHHVEPPARRAWARELARVVRRGGIAALFEHNPLNPFTRLAVSRCEFDDGVELLGRREATALLASAGLKPLERRYIVFFPWPRSRAMRLEARLGRLPFGAQHLVAARRPPRCAGRAV
jgi:SAM-dependent methyltransferase